MSVGLSEKRVMNVGGVFRNVEITGELRDFERRMREGDATIGWLGDDTLTLHVAFPVDHKKNPIKGGKAIYQVWGRDAQGNGYVCAEGDRADASLLRELVRRDSRMGNTFENFWAEVERAEAKAEQEFSDKLAAGYDRLQWAVRRDTGHLEGMKTTQFAVGDFKKDDNA